MSMIADLRACSDDGYGVLEPVALEDAKTHAADFEGLQDVKTRPADLQGLQDVKTQPADLQGVKTQPADLQGVQIQPADSHVLPVDCVETQMVCAEELPLAMAMASTAYYGVPASTEPVEGGPACEQVYTPICIHLLDLQCTA